MLAAAEAGRMGPGGVATVSKLFGIARKSVAVGRGEINDVLHGKALKRSSRPKGQPRTEDRFPERAAALVAIVEDEIAGNPMSSQKWVRSSVEKLSQKMREQGHNVGHTTVWRMLKRMGFSMRTNIRRRRGNRPNSPERDNQFKYIALQRKEFAAAGWPIISVDTKKKELIGEFRNPGRVWCRTAPEVHEHDFPSAAECRAVPFGIYDVRRNQGHVVVGESNDTSEFAVKAIAGWWAAHRRAYPNARELLILADCGGTNGYRSRAWKLWLQEKLCDPFGITVTVCHYPPGCSKFNPIERRLFSQISINWAGRPLKSIEVMLAYIRGTSTKTGLTVDAELDEGTYRKGQKVSKEAFARLRIHSHETCPDWNYTIRPRQ